MAGNNLERWVFGLLALMLLYLAGHVIWAVIR